ASNGYVYVYYTTSAAPVHNRVSRFKASTGNPDVADPAETILVDLDNLSGATNHNGGALRFGLDGKLYVAVGENANASNSQALTNRHGKVLRYNADGSIPADNPFYATAAGANRAIWALGLRNPYTFAIQPGTGRMMINDVGANTWEEINEGIAGRNFGWPASEGDVGCTASGFTCPVYSYPHSQGCAITGGAFYNPPTASFPASYLGKYLFADYCDNWIKLIDPDAPPSAGNATTFATDVPAPVDLRVGSDGSLYYLARGSGSVGRIESSAAQPPAITQDPLPQTVPVGGSATFGVSASGSSPLAIRWQRNRVDIPGATSGSYTLTGAQASDSGALFRAVVTNAYGEATSAEALLTVTTNTPPAPTIVAPAVNTRYNAGQTIGFSGSASDGQDPSIPASAYTWQVDFHHDAHTHPFVAPLSGVTGGSFTIPTSGETATNVWYRLYLTVRDSGGLTGTVTRDILPNVATLSFATSPAGLPLTLDAQPLASPSVDSVVGMQRAIGAPAQATSGGKTWQFSSWSDGGARNHTIVTPAGGGTYTANYVEVPSANVALATLGAVASASSSFSVEFAPSTTIDGETAGVDWGNGGGWNDATGASWPDWLQVAFDGPKTIDRVVVYSLQDNYASPSPPTDAMTFSLYGITAFQVQAWNGSAWSTIATVSGNNLVKRTVTFAPVTTDRIRIRVTDALLVYSRIVEVEAWTPGTPAPAATTTTLASSANPSTLGQPVSFTATVTGSAPTGSVAFRDGAATIAGCTAVALAGSGNARTASCTPASLAQGTHSITAAYAGDAANAPSTSSALAQVVNAAGSPVNVARASSGGVATASSQLAGYSAASAIDGNPTGPWGSDGGWNDATGASWPDWLQVAFDGPKTIDRVVVYSLQDNYASPSPPTDAMTFSLYGITAFQVQAWNGSAWSTIATVSGNNLVKRTVTFAPVTTDRIRIRVTGALLVYSRIVEVEAWAP
ncbi:MAG TPA: PQQ-dependent sugar dehydrogenase, partial [Casimicrobiaceae bacterium]|nr:PQQ-dependent sugar dehydrogenase [Casimicrobiaceae bacterium]